MSRIWGSNSKNNLKELRKYNAGSERQPQQHCRDHLTSSYLLEMTLRCSSCRSNVARAHKPPYTATLLGESSWRNTRNTNGRETPFRAGSGITTPISSPPDSHSGQMMPAESTWQLVCIFEMPVLLILKNTGRDHSLFLLWEKSCYLKNISLGRHTSSTF